MSWESGRNKQFSLENNQKFIIKREEVQQVLSGTHHLKEKYKNNYKHKSKYKKFEKFSIIVFRAIFMPVSMCLISSTLVALNFESGN